MDLIAALCEAEQKNSDPFIQREAWRALLALLALKYQSSPCRALEDALILWRAHYMWRLLHLDVVYVLHARPPGAAPLLLQRVAHLIDGEMFVMWANARGDCLRVPCFSDSTASTTESFHTGIVGRFGAPSLYRSRASVGLNGAKLWMRRRALAVGLGSNGDEADAPRNDDALSTTAPSLSRIQKTTTAQPRAAKAAPRSIT